jgi:hypothetical protein
VNKKLVKENKLKKDKTEKYKNIIKMNKEVIIGM